MKKIKVVLDVGIVGARREGTLEFEDDTTDEEIQADVEQWMWEHIDLCWYEVKDGER